MNVGSHARVPFGEAALAGRFTRWVAMILDRVVPLVFLLLVFRGPGGFSEDAADFAVRRLGVGLVAFGIFTCVQWYLVATTGQTLGKKLFGIKIVMVDGSPVGFWTGVVLRDWAIGFLGALPFVGGIIGLADALYIFHADRRCLHDRIAGTIVVRTDAIELRAQEFAFGPPPPTANADLLTRLRTWTITPEIMTEVDLHLQKLSREGMTREALATYEALASRGPVRLSDRALLVAEQAAAEHGRPELAVSIVQRMMTLHRDSRLVPRALWDIAQLQRREGREELAQATLRALVDRYPTDPFADQARALLH